MIQRTLRGLMAVLLVGLTLAIVPPSVAPSASAADQVTRTSAPTLNVHATNPAISQFDCAADGPCYAISGGQVARMDGDEIRAYLATPFTPGELSCDEVCVVWSDTQFSRIDGDTLSTPRALPIVSPWVASCTVTACSFLSNPGERQLGTVVEGVPGSTVVTLPPATVDIGVAVVTQDWFGLECVAAGCLVSSIHEAPGATVGALVRVVGGVAGPVVALPRMALRLECTDLDTCVGVGVRFAPDSFFFIGGVVRIIAGSATATDLQPLSLDGPDEDDWRGTYPIAADPFVNALACVDGISDCWMPVEVWDDERPVLYHVIDGVPQPVIEFAELEPGDRFDSVGCGAFGCVVTGTRQSPAARIAVTNLSVPTYPGLEVHTNPASPREVSLTCEQAGPCWGLHDLYEPQPGIVPIVGGELGAPVTIPEGMQTLVCDDTCIALGETGFVRVVDGVARPFVEYDFAVPPPVASCHRTSCTTVGADPTRTRLAVLTFTDGDPVPQVAILPNPQDEPGYYGMDCPAPGSCVLTIYSYFSDERAYVTVHDGVVSPKMAMGGRVFDLSCSALDRCIGVSTRDVVGGERLGVALLGPGGWTFQDVPGQTGGGLSPTPDHFAEVGGEAIACLSDLADCWISAEGDDGLVFVHVVDGVPQPARRVTPKDASSYGVACSAVEGCVAMTGVAAGTSPEVQYVVTGLPLEYGLPDSAPPTAAIASPVDGAEVLAGAALAADFTCDDGLDGSGIATCVGTLDGQPLVSGDALPTDVAGDHTVVVVPTDLAGNVGDAVEATYTVLPGSKVDDVIPGGTISTGDEATTDAPVQTSITTATGGDGAYEVSIQPVDPGTAPQGYRVLDQAVLIEADDSNDPASAANPHRVTFTIDGSVLGATQPEDVVVLRDGEVVEPCNPAEPVIADPVPCAEPAVLAAPPSDDVLITVRTDHFSDWGFATRVAPTAFRDQYTVEQGRTLVVEAPGVLANDTLVTSEGAPAPRVDLDGGDLSGVLAFDNHTGAFTYTPDPDVVGVDETFRYHVSQGHGDEFESNVAEVTIHVVERSQVATTIVAEPFIIKMVLGLVPFYTLRLDATLKDADGIPVVGAPVVFSRKGLELCTVATDITGRARCSLLASKTNGLIAALQSLKVDATYAGNDDYLGSTTIAPWYG